MTSGPKGAIILPSVWKSIVKPFTSIRITFKEETARIDKFHDNITESPVERPFPVRFHSVEAFDAAVGADGS